MKCSLQNRLQISKSKYAAGFTLLELMTVLIIISLLVTMTFPIVNGFREKSARLACVNNLKALYTAATGYTTDHQQWPQITADIKSGAYGKQWIEALKPYQIAKINWRCPTVESKLGNPLRKDPEDVRLDYFATPFGPEPRAAFKWANQPWFIERSDSHGDGNLMIFADSNIRSLGEVLKMRVGPPQ